MTENSVDESVAALQRQVDLFRCRMEVGRLLTDVALEFGELRFQGAVRAVLERDLRRALMLEREIGEARARFLADG